MDLHRPGLHHVCPLLLALAPIMKMGKGRAGDRRIIPITGGTASGPKF